jgi:hypothetical protein
MRQPKFQLYKHIKISGKWRYCRAAIYSNGKVKPHVVVVGGQEEKHEEGSYCIRHKSLGSKLVPNRWTHSGCAASSLTKPNTPRCSLRLSRRVRRSRRRPRDTSPILKPGARCQEHSHLPHWRRPIRPNLQEAVRRRRDQAGHARLHGLAPQAAVGHSK